MKTAKNAERLDNCQHSTCPKLETRSFTHWGFKMQSHVTTQEITI